ncbi:MAG TPA: hypothetical protein VJ867_06600 [Gemmatimonadaceae bacterium]|nr:hypothetical protein [Gemmatimonadaceae bacterium]
MRSFVRTLALPAAIVLIGGASCSDSTAPSNDIRDYITGVAAATGGSASFHSGDVPSDGSGPVVTVSGNSAMILGGSALRNLSSGSAFTHVVVAIAGVDGYWDLTVPSTTSQNVTLTLAQNLPQQSFTVQYAAGTGAGVGAFDTEPVTIIQVGTGDIQVSVSWNTATDVDLHLLEPGGEEIFYGNDQSAAGGSLDLDSNAGCSIDNKNNENITYPNVTPPHGTYTVRVDYWDSCNISGSTTYVVTVQVKGHATQTFNGTFTGTGDNGGSGSGTTITTFTY